MNDGGPAFPNMSQVNANGQHLTYATQGMSLRDFFAGQALAGDMASQSAQTGEFVNTTPMEFLIARAALFYKFADAMLKAREERKS